MSFFGEVDDDFNEYKVAWLSKDENKIKELANRFDNKKENDIFTIVRSVSSSKELLPTNFINDFYDERFVNLALSQSPECLYEASFMNIFGTGLPSKMQYDYYYNALRKGKKYTKWVKYDEDLEQSFIIYMISKKYTINNLTSNDYLEMIKLDGQAYKSLLNDFYNMTSVDKSIVSSFCKSKTDINKLYKIVEKWSIDYDSGKIKKPR